MSTEREQIRGKAITTQEGELNCLLWHASSFIHLNINEVWMPIELEEIQKLLSLLQYGGTIRDVEIQRRGDGKVRFVWESSAYVGGKGVVIALVSDIEKELYPILHEALSPERQERTLELRKFDVQWEASRQRFLEEQSALDRQRWGGYTG